LKGIQARTPEHSNTAALKSPESFLLNQQELVALARHSLGESLRTSQRTQDFAAAKAQQLSCHSSIKGDLLVQDANMTTAEAPIASAAFSYEAQVESPTTSRFTAVNTAVNGREPSSGPAISSTNSQPQRRDSGEERTKGQPRISPPGQEKLTITTTTTQREDWSNTVNGDRQGQSYSQSAGPEGENSHKRKRSASLDRTPAQTSSTSSYHSHGLPASKPHQDSGLGESPETREASIRTPLQTARDPYTSASQAQYTQFSEENREHGAASGLWYSQNSQDTRTPADTQHSAVSHQRSPEEHLREALQRDAAQGLDSQGAYATSPGDDDDRNMSYQGGYNPEGRTALQIQQDHKKRKRNFSNRTKTGCMTCRRRKKKCGEERPECKSSSAHILIYHGLMKS
jgi:hypothetical protein